MDNLNLALCRINWGANVVNSEYKIKKIFYSSNPSIISVLLLPFNNSDIVEISPGVK